MIQFLIKRLVGLVFVVIGVTFITFIMGYFAPGDPIHTLLGQHFNMRLYLQLKHAYGLDLPWYQQYFNFLVRLLHFDFGLSFTQQDRDVWDILKGGVPVSFELGFWAIFIQMAVGIPLGVFSALKANTWLDTTNMGIMLFLYAIPVFVLAVVVQVIIVWIDQHTGGTWPVSSWGTPWQYTWNDLQFKIAPILVFAVAGLAYIARLARTSTLEILRQDYIRTARAKGLVERIVIYRHALRNALIPLVTVFGFTLGLIVTGSFFIEQIFNIPGIAQITITSVNSRDYPVIQATTVILAVAVVIGNLISDILYTVVDPRIKIH
ncbi:ABC transporter permease [Ktedonosporobacter rubrisoli]|uniref:ABC transporter permease n=1 Tax=Ktedonosporobacter rubrisoli TaxID=2509675 RepID=A0A4P6K2A5_KTERU|nr:ABC transporter permease [Ktedonosporobacter rubrisoli]QBD82135.1 ABC transporter permease [Ktedonosporobacter rubrisoli]